MEKSNCTFGYTGDKYMYQFWCTCYTCFGSGNEHEGACMSCVETCHKGHDLGPLRHGHFFCDCGDKKLCKNPPSDPGVFKSTIPARVYSDDSSDCSDDSTGHAMMPSSGFKESINTLAKKMFDSFENHAVYSPLSISYILSLLHIGAVDNTDAQLTDLLGRKKSMEDLVKSSILWNKSVTKLANVIVVNEKMPVKQEYLDIVQKLAMIGNRDFSNKEEIVNEINSFIEENTNGLIKDALENNMVNDTTVMLLVNTLYFKCDWKYKFEAKNTKQEIFGGCHPVDMMMACAKLYYFSDDYVQMCCVPYKSDNYVMVIVLPTETFNTRKCIDYLVGKSQCRSRNVELHIPKFTQRNKTDLIPILREIGLTDIFCSRSRLDNIVDPVSGMETYVSMMCHSVVVVVDEVGTEAAAKSVGDLRCFSMVREEEPVVFYANRPFVYGIKDKSGTLMFVGSYHGYSN